MASLRFVLPLLLVYLHGIATQTIYECETSPPSAICVLRGVQISTLGEIDQIELPEEQQFVHFIDGHIPTFDQSIYGQLETTTNLTVTGCQVEKLFVAAQLVHLNASGNKLQGVEREAGDDYSGLKVLDLSKNDNTKIPNVKDFVGLEWLDLSENKISLCTFNLINKLTKLKWLNLADNGISSLEGAIELRNLEELRLNGNKLLEIDFLNWMLPALTMLDLRDNLLMYLNADDLERPFPKLERLELIRNQWNCQTLTKFVERIKKRSVTYVTAVTSRCPSTSVQGICCEDSYVNSVTLQSQWDIRKLQRQMKTMNDTLVAKLAAVRQEQGAQIVELEKKLVVQEKQMVDMKAHLLRMARLIEDLIEELYLRQMEGAGEGVDQSQRKGKKETKIVF